MRCSLSQVRRLLPPSMGGSTRVDAPPEPLWNIDDVTTFMRNQEDHGELIKTVQANQKSAARATKRRRNVAEGMKSTSDGKIQTKIVQFGILHHKKKRPNPHVSLHQS